MWRAESFAPVAQSCPRSASKLATPMSRSRRVGHTLWPPSRRPNSCGRHVAVTVARGRAHARNAAACRAHWARSEDAKWVTEMLRHADEPGQTPADRHGGPANVDSKPPVRRGHVGV